MHAHRGDYDVDPLVRDDFSHNLADATAASPADTVAAAACQKQESRQRAVLRAQSFLKRCIAPSVSVTPPVQDAKLGQNSVTCWSLVHTRCMLIYIRPYAYVQRRVCTLYAHMHVYCHAPRRTDGRTDGRTTHGRMHTVSSPHSLLGTPTRMQARAQKHTCMHTIYVPRSAVAETPAARAARRGAGTIHTPCERANEPARR